MAAADKSMCSVLKEMERLEPDTFLLFKLRVHGGTAGAGAYRLLQAAC